MDVAWTTLFVIALLLPGAAFFVGAFSRERFSREVIRANAIAELGAALLLSIVIHIAALALLKFWLHVPVGNVIHDFLKDPNIGDRLSPDDIERSIIYVGSYILGTSISSYVLGWLVAITISLGWLRGLGIHKWAYDLRSGKGRGVVTTYIMTNIILNDKAIMYEGQLNEIYLTSDGKISYVVLKDCSRYYLGINNDSTFTGPRLGIMRNLADAEDSRIQWNYFHITGDKIANILFRKNPEVKADRKAEELLNSEVEAAIERLLRAHEAGHAANIPSTDG